MTMTRLPLLAAALLAATAFLAAPPASAIPGSAGISPSVGKPALAEGGPGAVPGKGHGKGHGKHGDWKPLAFETLDANKDGNVTLAELKAGLKDKPKRLQKADKMFARLDANKDGKASKAEFDAWKARRAQKRAERGGDQR